MDFINGKELLELCFKYDKPISEIMRQREIRTGNVCSKEIEDKLERVLKIMVSSTHTPLEHPVASIGGLLGGEAKRINEYKGANLCGSVLTKAIAYAMAVPEVNASMGLIVAAPTAGSSGVVPGVLLAVSEAYGFSEEQMKEALLNAGAIGYLLMRNASVSGAEAGCQAEVGAASAMAASALIELFGGTPNQCLIAAAMAISNLLGLVCDPVAGLVEVPCQSRNAIGASNSITCAQLVLSGLVHPIPFDEMAEAMYTVGKALPFEFRESAMGGCASTPTGCGLCKQLL